MQVITPRDPAYDEARSVWNGDIDRRPRLIARCETPQDVAEAIELARREGLELTVRGGGHNFAGSAVADDALMIHLGAMNAVAVDRKARRVRCGGGATWGDVDAAAQAHGLGVTGGIVSHTGVGGLTLGGGMGWLSRRMGLSCDNLLSAQMVLANGRIVRVSEEQEPELFWAIRGGGGNFGVVTEFEFALHELPQTAQLALLFWELDRAAEGLRLSRDVVAGLPDDTGSMILGLSAPPEPFVPEQYRLMPGAALAVVSFGSPEQHAELIAPARQELPPLWELVTPIPYVALQKMFDEIAEWGRHAYEKALYFEELTDEAIDVFVDFIPRRRSPLSFAPIFPLYGAYARAGDDDTAFGGSRSARFAFNMTAIAPTPELLPADRDWVRSCWDALTPFASGSGSYVNFMAEMEESRIRASYGEEKYARLARIKGEVDPDNVFHRNVNIKPAVART